MTKELERVHKVGDIVRLRDSEFDTDRLIVTRVDDGELAQALTHLVESDPPGTYLGWHSNADLEPLKDST